MYTQARVLFMWKEDVELKFKEFCCSGKKEDFNDLEKNTYELQKALDTDSIVHGAILAIHHDNFEALEYLFKNFSEILEIKIKALLTAAANHNKIRCIEYLLQQKGANPKELEGTSSYSNFESIKRLFDEQGRRLDWAIQNKDSDNCGIKANALYILHKYYLGGWCGIAQDPSFAKKCLKESAELGLARAIYDFTRDALFSFEREQAKEYIKQALQENKLDDDSFDLDGYKQRYMKEEVENLLKVIEVVSDGAFQNRITNKGTMNITDNGVEFDDVDFYGIDLKGSFPLSPRIKTFLESKGNSITQSNGKIIFNGDFLNTFSQKEVTKFLTHRLVPTLKL